MRFAVEDFFPTSRFMQEKEKLSTDKPPTTRFAVEFFLSYELLKSRKRRIFFTNELHTRAVEVREAKEAVESARAGLSPQKEGDVRKTRKEKKKTKEGGLSPQEGDVRKTRKERKRKRPRQARKWLQRRQGSCALHQELLFFGSRVFGLGSGPSRLKFWLLRDLVYKEAMCKGSSGNGLLYAAKAVP